MRVVLSIIAHRLGAGSGRVNVVQGLFSLNGQLALVTGSATGIGYALARGLAQAGARIVLNDRDQVRLTEATASLASEGLCVHQAVFDVTKGNEVRAAIDRVEAEVGAVDILINNAGIQRRMPLDEFPEED
jgi:gluconate 5-dehydrogenase